MVVQLDEKVCSLNSDELVVYVRLSFNIDKDGYIYGSNKVISELAGLSVARYKKAIEGLFEKQMVSIGVGKVFIFGHDKVSYSEGEQPAQYKAESEKSTKLEVTSPSVLVDDKAKQAADYFNKVISGKGMPQIKALTPKRKAMVNARIKDYGFDNVIIAINNAAASNFLNGGTGWTGCDFEWIMRPNNFIKVLEGKYNNGSRNQGANKSAEQNYYQESADLVQRLNQQRKATNI